MRRTGNWLISLALGVVFTTGGGCDCGSGGSSTCRVDADCGSGNRCDTATGQCVPVTAPPGITILGLDHNQLNVLQTVDDIDQLRDGFQYDVAIEAVNIEAGQQATLCKLIGEDTEGLDCATVELVERDAVTTATFAAYTLDVGVQTLRVTATNLSRDTAEDQVEVRVLAPDECVVSFTAPADGAALTGTDDLDPDTPELQYNVRAETSNVEAGRVCELTVGNRSPVEATVGDAVAEFPATGLPQADTLALTVACTNNAGGTCEDQISVAVDLGDCQATIAPASTSFNAETPDADPDADGLQTTVTVSTDCPDGTDVVLTVDGTALPAVSTASGQATILIDLIEDTAKDPAGPTEVEADLAAVDGRTGHDVATYSVDLTPPEVTITDPADGVFLGPPWDQDIATPTILDYPVSCTVAGGVAGTVLSLYIDGLTDPFTTYEMTATDADQTPVFAHRFDDVPFEDGPHEITVTANDAVANLGEDTVGFTATMVEPAIQINDPPAGALGCGADSDGTTDGLQYEVCAQTANVSQGTVVTLTVDNGSPVDTAVGADGAACTTVTLEDGSRELEACVTPAGHSELCSEVVTVDVDWTPPVVAIAAPADGALLNTATLGVSGSVAGAPDGAAITLRVDAGTPLTGTVVDGGFAFADVALGADGEHTLDASVTLDNTCTGEATTTVTLDTLSPTLEVRVRPQGGSEEAVGARTLLEADDLDQTCNDGFQTDVLAHTGGVPEGTPVTLQINNYPPILMPTDAAGTALFPAVTLVQGDNTVAVSVADAAGNLTALAPVQQVDCGCPVATVAPEPGATLSAAHDVDAGTDGVQIDVTVDADTPGLDCTLDWATGTGCAQTLTQSLDGSGDTAFRVTLCDGVNAIHLQTDDAGKICQLADYVVVLKTGAPTVAFGNLVADQYLNLTHADADAGTPGFQFAVQITTTNAEDGSAARLVVNGTDEYTATVATNAAVFPLVTLCAEAACPGADATLVATVTDLAEQVSDPAEITVHVDRVAPEVTITRPAVDMLIRKDDVNPGLPGFQYDVVVSVTGVEGDQTLALTINGGGEITQATVAGTTGYTFPAVEFLENQANRLDAAVSDAAGNPATDTTNVDVDTDAPVIEFNLPAGNRSWIRADDQDDDPGLQRQFIAFVDGLDAGGDAVMCTDNGGDTGHALIALCAGGEGVLATGIVASSSATFTPTFTDGVHHIHLAARDGNGNEAQSTAPASLTITVDATSPRILSLVIDSNSNTANDVPPTIVLGAAEDAEPGTAGLQAEITVTTEGVEDGQVLTLASTGGLPGTRTAVVSSNQAVFKSTKAPGEAVTLAEGGHLLSATVSDAAGNPNVPAEDPAEAKVNLRVDSVLPTIAFVAPSDTQVITTNTAGTTLDGDHVLVDVTVHVEHAGQTVDATVSLSGAADPVADQQVSVPGDTGVDVIFEDVKLAQGANDLTASATTSAGNTTDPVATRTLDVDTLPPTITGLLDNDGAAIDGRTYLLPEDKDGDLGTGFGRDLRVTVSGVDDASTVLRLQDRLSSAGAFANMTHGRYDLGASENGDLIVGSGDTEGVILTEGADRDIQAVITDGNGNQFVFPETGTYTYLVDVQVPALVLKKADGTVIGNDTGFLAGDKTGTPPAFQTTITAESDAAGETVTLTVNEGTGDLYTDTATVTGGVATFTGVVLQENPFGGSVTNTIKASVTDGNTKTVSYSGIVADGVVPSVTFHTPAEGHTYLAGDDAQPGTPGLQFGSGATKVVVRTTDVEPGQTVTLTDSLPGGILAGATAAVVDQGGSVYAATFSDLQLASDTGGATHVLTATVSDAAGNPATTDPGGNLTVHVDVVTPADFSLATCKGRDVGTDADSAPECDPDHASTVCASADDCDPRRANLRLFWTAVGDDGTTGTVDHYTIEYRGFADPAEDCSSFTPGDVANTVETKDTGLAANPDTETYTVSGLPLRQTWCVAVTAHDALGNTSSAIQAGPRSTYFDTQEFVGEEAVNGDAANFGQVLAGGTSVDGDTLDDLLIGTWVTAGAPPNTPSAYVFFGNAGLGTDPLTSDAHLPYHATTAPGGYIRLDGPVGSWFGFDGSIGDVNGETGTVYPDVVVGAPADAGWDGSAFVYFGAPAATFKGDPAFDVKITGSGGGRLGWGLASGGVSLNALGGSGDALPDLALGAWIIETVYVYLGSTAFAGGGPYPKTVTAAATADLVLTGADEYFGMKLASGGDVDGDGAGELLITTMATSIAGGDWTPRVYMVWGAYLSSLDYSSQVTKAYHTDLAAADKVELLPAAPGNAFGGHVTFLDDLDGDGRTDICVSTETNPGGTAFVYLSTDVAAGNPWPQPSLTMSREGADYFGYTCQTAGDLDDNGYNDLVIGAQNRALIYLNGAGGLPTTPSLTILGLQAQNGATAVDAGDFNGDGLRDLGLGAWEGDGVTALHY